MIFAALLPIGNAANFPLNKLLVIQLVMIQYRSIFTHNGQMKIKATHSNNSWFMLKTSAWLFKKFKASIMMMAMSNPRSNQR